MTVRAVRDCLDAAETKLHDATDEILGMLEERCRAIVGCLDGLDDEVVSAVESAVDKSKVHMRSGIQGLMGDAEKVVAKEAERIDAFLAGAPVALARPHLDARYQGAVDAWRQEAPGAPEEWLEFFAISGMAANRGIVEPDSEVGPDRGAKARIHRHTVAIVTLAMIALSAGFPGLVGPLVDAVEGALLAGLGTAIAKGGQLSEEVARFADTPAEGRLGQWMRSIAREVARPIGPPGGSIDRCVGSKVKTGLRLWEEYGSKVLPLTTFGIQMSGSAVVAAKTFVSTGVSDYTTWRLARATGGSNDATEQSS